MIDRSMTAARRLETKPAGRRGAPGRRNRVRIIAGQWRSRLVEFPDTPGLRPTPDRVRETLFNWLGQRLDGLACLDLFAGSGALGFEALSRGARRVVMVERDRQALAALRHTRLALQAANLEIQESEAMRFLDRSSERFDVAFVDPPYAANLLEPVLQRLPEHLNEGARVYAEGDAPLEPGPPWRTLREDRAGSVRFGLYEYAPCP
jgi:16S rRNA (guanine966-N2)-methyltransferase